MTELPEIDLQYIHEHAKPKSLKRGEILFKQNTSPRSVVWLINGKAKILQETPGGQKQTVYIYSDGDLIGYRQLIAGEVHPVSAVLLEDATVILIPGIIFKTLLDQSPSFARSMITALSRDFTVWMNRTTVFTKYPVRHRLMLALLILLDQYEHSGSPKGVITITRTELAQYVGASLETVVRELNKLKRKNVVEVSGRRILINDTRELMRMLTGEEV
jgi:CRP-like cAMP-binding protein